MCLVGLSEVKEQIKAKRDKVFSLKDSDEIRSLLEEINMLEIKEMVLSAN